MLKERVTELIDCYEYGDAILTPTDVRDELDEIIDEEPWEEPLSYQLSGAVFCFTNRYREARKYGGRVDDGGDDFIARVKELIGYE